MLKKLAYLMVVSMALVGAMTGCRGPDSGPMTPAGSPGTGTTVPRTNTPGLSGTGSMAPANQGTDTRTRTSPGTDAGVTGPRTAPPPPADATREPSPPIRPNTPPQPPTTEPPTPPTSRPSL